MSQQYKTILVPVDGSMATPQLIERAIQIAKTNGAHLDILNVVEINQFSDSYGGAISGDVVYSLVEDIEARLDSLKTQASEAGLTDVSTHVRFGNPKPVIAREFPDDHGTDLTVIGTTGMSAVERFMVGSVTTYVNRISKNDVLVVQIK